MATNASRTLQGSARPEALTKNERVTARIVRESDETTHHEYRVGGRVYGSLDALNAALEGQ
jgi:hypothetical protein